MKAGVGIMDTVLEELLRRIKTILQGYEADACESPGVCSYPPAGLCLRCRTVRDLKKILQENQESS